MAGKDFSTEVSGTRAGGLMMTAFVLGLVGIVLMFTVIGSLLGLPLVAIAVVLGIYAGYKRS